MNCDVFIKDEWSKAGYQNQNPGELGHTSDVKWLKEMGTVLMYRSNAPESGWVQAHEYLVDLHTITADETLNWKSPQEVVHGETPEISLPL